MIKKFVFVSALLAVVVSAFGQAPPNGGGGGVGGGDHWVQDSVTLDGHTYGYDYGSPQGATGVVPFDIPWSSGLERPGAVNYTSESQGVQITTEGTITYHMRWTGATPPPNKYVLIRVWSNTYGTYAPAGSASADNGLGSSPYTVVNPDGLCSWGSKLRVYDGSEGHFDIVVSVRGEGDATGPWAVANADKSTSIEVLNRGISLIANSVVYRKSFTGQTIYSHGGSYPEAKRDYILAEEDASGALYQSYSIGIPLVSRDYYDNNLCYTHIDAHAQTWGDHQPTETFQWHTPMDNTSGSLPSYWTGYEIGDAGVVNFEWPVREFDHSITMNGAHQSATASIDYTWSDGFTLTNKFTITSRLQFDNHILFKSIDYTEDGQMTWQLSAYGALSGWSQKFAPSVTCDPPNKDATLGAAGKIATYAIAAGGAFSEAWPIQLLCLASGILLDNFPISEPPVTYMESLDEFKKSVARTPSQGWWVDSLPVGEIDEQRMREYVFQIMFLPLYQTDWYVADKWNSSGYDGQDEESVRWQKSVSIGYRYKLNLNGA